MGYKSLLRSYSVAKRREEKERRREVKKRIKTITKTEKKLAILNNY